MESNRDFLIKTKRVIKSRHRESCSLPTLPLNTWRAVSLQQAAFLKIERKRQLKNKSIVFKTIYR